MAIEYAIYDDLVRLSASLEGVKVTPKQAEFLRLVRDSVTTPAQLDAWIAANPDEAQDVFYSSTIVSGLMGNIALHRRIYDSVSATELALNSSMWWQEFCKYVDNVDVLVASDYGLEVLWGNRELLLDVYEKRDINGLWGRFYELATPYEYNWASSSGGRPAWASAGITNGVYVPHPAAAGNTIIVEFSSNTDNNTYSFNTRLRGGPEIVDASYNNTVTTFAAHTDAAGARFSGTGSAARSTIRLLHV